jgi:hypothetical protein
MESNRFIRIPVRQWARAAAFGLPLFAFAAIPAAAQVTPPQAVPPYTLRVFATGVTSASTQPDSIALSASGERVFIGYGNGVAKDGSDGKSSTIVEYTLNGSIVRQFSVVGHNDGLKLDPATGHLWALQNEDGNPNLVIINPGTGAATVYTFGPTAQGGGYDDIVFRNGRVFLSASNPQSNPNTAPAIVSAELEGHTVEVNPVLAGNATAIDIPTNQTVTLNLLDPDSMILSPEGDIVLDSQSDAELAIVQHPGQKSQQVFRLPISSAGASATVDDTVFSRSGRGFILVSDLDANIVYEIDRAFWPGQVPFSASDQLGLVAELDLGTGNLTPIATGFVNPRGMAFVREE